MEKLKELTKEEQMSPTISGRMFPDERKRLIAESILKINEIIDFINFVGQRDGNDSYLTEFNQSRTK